MLKAYSFVLPSYLFLTLFKMEGWGIISLHILHQEDEQGEVSLLFITQHQRRQQMRRLLLVFSGLFLVSIFGYSFFSSSSILTSQSPGDPQNVVEQFYSYERAGDFGSAWELFHPLMKERFTKQDYIRTRAQVFLQNFGVETFEVEMGNGTAEDSWKMSAASPELSSVQKFPVTLVYKSHFGLLKLVQDVYVAKEGEHYRILWPYEWGWIAKEKDVQTAPSSTSFFPF